jgi:hypothetical protein
VSTQKSQLNSRFVRKSHADGFNLIISWNAWMALMGKVGGGDFLSMAIN